MRFKVPDDFDIDSVISFEVIDNEIVMTLYGQQLLVVGTEFRYPEPEYGGYGFITSSYDYPTSVQFDTLRYRPKPQPPKPEPRKWSEAMGLRRPKGNR